MNKIGQPHTVNSGQVDYAWNLPWWIHHHLRDIVDYVWN